MIQRQSIAQNYANAMWALGVMNHAPQDGAASAVLEQIKIADKDSSSGQDPRIMQSFTNVSKTGQVSKTRRGNAVKSLSGTFGHCLASGKA